MWLNYIWAFEENPSSSQKESNTYRWFSPRETRPSFKALRHLHSQLHDSLFFSPSSEHNLPLPHIRITPGGGGRTCSCIHVASNGTRGREEDAPAAPSPHLWLSTSSQHATHTTIYHARWGGERDHLKPIGLRERTTRKEKKKEKMREALSSWTFYFSPWAQSGLWFPILVLQLGRRKLDKKSKTVGTARNVFERPFLHLLLPARRPLRKEEEEEFLFPPPPPRYISLPILLLQEPPSFLLPLSLQAGLISYSSDCGRCHATR